MKTVADLIAALDKAEEELNNARIARKRIEIELARWLSGCGPVGVKRPLGVVEIFLDRNQAQRLLNETPRDQQIVRLWSAPASRKPLEATVREAVIRSPEVAAAADPDVVDLSTYEFPEPDADPSVDLNFADDLTRAVSIGEDL